MNIKYKTACKLKAGVIAILLTLAYRLNAESMERVDANGTGLPFSANMNLSNAKADRGDSSAAQISLTITDRSPQTTPSLSLDNKAIITQTLSGKGGDAISSQVEQVIQTTALFNDSISVQPADAAYPKSLKAPVGSAFLAKIKVPYNDSLFINPESPYFLGLEIIPAWTNRERARHLLIP